MNILCIVDNVVRSNLGGVERVTLLLTEEFKRRGHNPFILSLKENDGGEMNQEGIPQYFIPFHSESFSAKLNELLKILNIDKVILQGVYNNIINCLDLLPAALPKILVLHNKPYYLHGYERKIMGLAPWRDLDLTHKILKGLAIISPKTHRRIITKRNGNCFRRITEKVQRFVVLSNRYIPEISKLTPGIDIGKIVAINNPNTFKIEEDFCSFEKENIVLVVGRLSHPQKNLFDFIRVWKKFHQLNPNWKAIVVGDGEHADVIKKYARKSNTKNIFFEGNRHNVADYYKKSKLFCMTSTFEGWPMVLPEAMAYGCVPVVFSTFRAVEDIILHGKSGILVSPFDMDKMVEEMDKIAKNPSLWEIMAHAGKETIQKFSVENIGSRWEELLQSL